MTISIAKSGFNDGDWYDADDFMPVRRSVPFSKKNNLKVLLHPYLLIRYFRFTPFNKI